MQTKDNMIKRQPKELYVRTKLNRKKEGNTYRHYSNRMKVQRTSHSLIEGKRTRAREKRRNCTKQNRASKAGSIIQLVTELINERRTLQASKEGTKSPLKRELRPDLKKSRHDYDQDIWSVSCFI